jgi:hypothetical protein
MTLPRDAWVNKCGFPTAVKFLADLARRLDARQTVEVPEARIAAAVCWSGWLGHLIARTVWR